MARDVFQEFRERRHGTFRGLFLKFYDYTSGYFFARTGHRQDSEDLNQELWKRVYLKAPGFGGTTFGEFFYWVKKIAYRLYLDRPVRREVEADVATMPAKGFEPYEQATIRESAEEMITAMHALREGDRDILLLRFYQELSYIEVGGALGVSADAARVRLHRALVRFGEALDARGSKLGKAMRPAELGEMLSWALPLARPAV